MSWHVSVDANADAVLCNLQQPDEALHFFPVLQLGHLQLHASIFVPLYEHTLSNVY